MTSFKGKEVMMNCLAKAEQMIFRAVAATTLLMVALELTNLLVAQALTNLSFRTTLEMTPLLTSWSM